MSKKQYRIRLTVAISFMLFFGIAKADDFKDAVLWYQVASFNLHKVLDRAKKLTVRQVWSAPYRDEMSQVCGLKHAAFERCKEIVASQEKAQLQLKIRAGAASISVASALYLGSKYMASRFYLRDKCLIALGSSIAGLLIGELIADVMVTMRTHNKIDQIIHKENT